LHAPTLPSQARLRLDAVGNTDTENPQQQLNLFSLIFEELPSYTNIVNGTAKMAWIFDISSVNPQYSNLVRLPGLCWNAIEYTIKKWMQVIDGLDFWLKDKVEHSFKTGIG
jgi:hypothetical protein